MNEIKLEVEGYYEVLNLHKALMEAKFHKNPDNFYVAGSPIIAKICNNIVDLLTEYEIEEKGKDTWSEWRKIENHNLFKERAVENAQNVAWEKLSYEEKETLTKNVFSPFTFTEKDVIDFINTVDGKFSIE
ncbi:hypothetical protein AMS59_23765 [Lysinibacillus sp. FJAT-14745]|uniref:hypothetical protein n=1 Tax=Lysinibacillus sp. FJAT-14745 TaxID=1704289 RepID=UPI0006AB8A00|nr:hypothetical protein [Lysinibacillus sp. FJAT-14745]KOP69390.1 hypothetical protein AMS59_23765 [Lysinibacillus sp. FJAT-14745]